MERKTVSLVASCHGYAIVDGRQQQACRSFLCNDPTKASQEEETSLTQIKYYISTALSNVREAHRAHTALANGLET